jgi:YidC/Oxa1 family membrane protein insertase
MEQKNVILAIVLSAIIIIGWGFLQPFLFPTPPAPPAQQQMSAPEQAPPAATTPGTAAMPGGVEAVPLVDRKTALAQSPRVAIDSPRLKGSISLKGGRLDDVELVGYRETVDPASPSIVLLSPAGTADAYFTEFGWVAEGGTKVPDKDTVWAADADKLTPDKPLTLSWDNGAGVRFLRVFSLDKDFMFTVTQRVENQSGAALKLHPFGRIWRLGTPAVGITNILQEGPLGAFGSPGEEKFYYKQYHTMPKDYGQAEYLDGTLRAPAPDNCHLHDRFHSTGGWLGINDKYWLVALVPERTQQLDACFRWQSVDKKDAYQVDYLGVEADVPPAGSIAATASLFVGAKEVSLLDDYKSNFAGAGIPLFDRAVDFSGYFPGYSLALIAKPLFELLDFIYTKLVHNFGIAIMLLTVLVKTVFFPLANKSYRAMNRMKKLAPQMTELRTRLGDDKVRLNQEMMALYKREKVNPAAGCLPLVVQIPVFIALYQVLYVTIEMRHAPFFGWIRDLSVPDPTSILNLFGLLPWHVPHDTGGFLTAWGLDAVPVIGHLLAGFLALINLGIWPLVLGVTMFLQQKMNPPPPDPVQAKIFMFLPIVFTFMMAQFQAGLVIYWSWNNLLSIAQQWLLKRMDERRERQAPKVPELKQEPQAEKQPEQQKPAKRLEHKSRKRT